MIQGNPYQTDIESILAKRHDNGWDYWTTPDKRLIKGSPFTALDCAFLLHELGMGCSEPILQETADLILSSWREDGRFKLVPQGAIYPCQTIHAARTLCHLGYASDSMMQKTFDHLLEIQHSDGGWRCKKLGNPHPPRALSLWNWLSVSAGDLSFLHVQPFLLCLCVILFQQGQKGQPVSGCSWFFGYPNLVVESLTSYYCII